MNSHRQTTLETLLYILSFLAAVSLRFIGLGYIALSDFEAANALQSLSLVNQSTATISGQPGFEILTAGLFSLFDSTEFLARLLPAVAGALIVFLPVLFKKQLGKNSTLIFSLLLAFEPVLVSISRLADGAMPSAAFLLLALGFLIGRRPVFAGIFLGAAFTFGSNIWLGLASLAAALIINWLVSDQKLSSLEYVEKPSSSDWKKFGISFAASLAVLSTGFFTHPRGISGIGLGLVEFIQGFKVQSLVSVQTMLLVFLCTEFPVLLLAAWSLIRGIIAKDQKRIFLTIWALAAGILAVIRPGRETLDWMWTLIPLWGLAAIGLSELLELFSSPMGQERTVFIVQVGLTLLLIGFSFLNLLSLLFNTYGDQQAVQTRLIGTLLPLGLLVMITLLISWGWSAEAAKKGISAATVGLLLVIVVSFSFKSAGAQQQMAADLWRPGAAVTGGKWLTRQLEDISLWNHGNRSALDIQVINQDIPSMRWNLRKFQETTYNSQYSSLTVPSTMIAPDYVEIGSSALYRGQALSWQQMPNFSAMKATEWVKWMIYREVPVEENRVILWARNDLFK